jgi:hypothetical protein
VRLLSSGTEPASRLPRMPLGLNLVSSGLLTVEQLREAASEQKEAGGEIGELLVRNGAVSEKQVTAIRAADWGCPVFTVPKHSVRIGIDIPSPGAALCDDSGPLRGGDELAVFRLRS